MELKKHASAPVEIRMSREANLSADIEGTRGKKKKRTRRTASKASERSSTS